MLSDLCAPPGLDSILGRSMTHSPDLIVPHHMNISTLTLSSDDSDETIEISDLEEEGLHMGFPLQRMDSIQVEEEENDDDRLTALYRACMAARLESNYEDATSEGSETSSLVWDDIDFEHLVDTLPQQHTQTRDESYISIYPPNSGQTAPLTMHTLTLPANPDSPESLSPMDRDDTPILVLLLALNTPELRSDPWNPFPIILRAVERTCEDDASKGSTVYLFHPPLVPLDNTTRQEEEQGTVAHWIDFLRQIFEGLAFLHENQVVWGGFTAIEPPSPPGLETGKAREVEMIMMDISSDPNAFASTEKWSFDRSRYPVKYYFTNFRRARQISPTTAASPISPFAKDIQSCGLWLESLIRDIPLLRGPLLPLTQAMKSGTFTADGARRLFEARARSLNLRNDKFPWDEKVASVRWRPSSRLDEEEELKPESGIRRARTLDVRPGMGASWMRVTEAPSLLLHPPPLIRSQSNPIPKENTKKDVFGDLSFVHDAKPARSIPVSFSELASLPRSEKESESTSTSTSTLSPNTNVPSPIFTISSLAPPTSSLSEVPNSPPPPPPTSFSQCRRKTLALGTVFSRKITHSSSAGLGTLAQESGSGTSPSSSCPPSPMKVGRSISMPVAGSGTWAK